MVRENQDLEEQLREIGRSQEQLREEEERLEGQNAQTSREIERLTGELERARQDSDARRQELSGAQMETSGLHQRHPVCPGKYPTGQGGDEAPGRGEERAESGAPAAAARPSPPGRRRLAS